MHRIRNRTPRSLLLVVLVAACDSGSPVGVETPDVSGVYESTEFSGTNTEGTTDFHAMGVLIRLELHPNGNLEREIWTGATYTFAEGSWRQDRRSIVLQFDAAETFTEQAVRTPEYEFESDGDSDRFRGAARVGASDVDFLFVRMPNSVPIIDRLPS